METDDYKGVFNMVERYVREEKYDENIGNGRIEDYISFIKERVIGEKIYVSNFRNVCHRYKYFLNY